jgi:hypothetical protein
MEAAHRITAQPKMPSGPAQPSPPVRISPTVSAGPPGGYRLTAGTGGRQVGSVMVHAREKGAVEVTDLHVSEAQRGSGIGKMLVASAARTGQQYGKSKMTLAVQDNGSGHLTQWYKGMGFTQVGVNHRGYPQLEAPISRVLAGNVQRQAARSSVRTVQAMKARWGYERISERDEPSAQLLSLLAHPTVFPRPKIKTQTTIVEELETLYKKGHIAELQGVICLGGIFCQIYST